MKPYYSRKKNQSTKNHTITTSKGGSRATLFSRTACLCSSPCSLFQHLFYSTSVKTSLSYGAPTK